MANEEPAAMPEAELEKDVEVTKVEDAAKLTPEQVVALVKERDTLAAQKGHWRGKAIDPVSGKPYRDLVSAKPVTPANTTPTPPATGQLEKDVAHLKVSEEKRSFGHAHGLSPEATDNVFSYAQGRNIKPEDALKDSFVKSGLEALKASERTRSNVPGPSNRSAVVGGKSFQQMDKNERRANFGKFTGADRG